MNNKLSCLDLKLNMYAGAVLLAFTLLSGCSSAPTITPPPLISEAEAFKYEKKLLAEYEQIKLNNLLEDTLVKWIQPANKKDDCKVYVEVADADDDRTLDENFKIYWDGKCKNGYASGLGREFERATLTNMNAIALYKEKGKMPKYFRNTYNLIDLSVTGDLVNDYVVIKTITDNTADFNIEFESGYTGENYKTYLVNSPFSEYIYYIKHYPNFNYIYFKNNGEFDNLVEKISMTNKAGNDIGFLMEKLRDGRILHYEMTESGGKVKRQVSLPSSYIKKMLAVKSEIIENATKATNIEEEANIAIKQYMLTICRDSVSVNFIDNKEYKEICKNSEYKTNLRAKISAKFLEINQIKAEKREAAYQKKLIDVRISQANSAARQASAVEDASFNQSIQNMNQNTQMQNLNNNLFMMRMGL